jgi:hypothetical protein
VSGTSRKQANFHAISTASSESSPNASRALIRSECQDLNHKKIILTAELIKLKVKCQIAREFDSREILLFFDGSTSGTKPYASPLNGISDVDLTFVAPLRFRTGNSLNLTQFGKMTKAIKKAINTLATEDGIYVVTSHNFTEEALIEGTVKWYLRAMTKKQDINVTILDCVFYPSINAITSWSNLRTDGLLFAIGLINHPIAYGDNATRDILLKEMMRLKQERDKKPTPLSELHKAILNAEKHIADAHVFADSNLWIPEDTVAQYTLKRLKVVGTTIGNALIGISNNGIREGNGSWRSVLENRHRFPQYLADFMVTLQSIRNGDGLSNGKLQNGELPTGEKLASLLSDLHSEAANVIRLLRIDNDFLD